MHFTNAGLSQGKRKLSSIHASKPKVVKHIKGRLISDGDINVCSLISDNLLTQKEKPSLSAAYMFYIDQCCSSVRLFMILYNFWECGTLVDRYKNDMATLFFCLGLNLIQISNYLNRGRSFKPSIFYCSHNFWERKKCFLKSADGVWKLSFSTIFQVFTNNVIIFLPIKNNIWIINIY